MSRFKPFNFFFQKIANPFMLPLANKKQVACILPDSKRKEWIKKVIMKGLNKKQQWPFAFVTAEEFPKAIRNHEYWNNILLIQD